MGDRDQHGQGFDEARAVVLEGPPVPMYQAPGEYLALWEHVARLRPATVVEIGSLFGGTLWGWLQLPGVERVVSVDQVTEWAPIRGDVLAARESWATWPGASRLVVVEGDSHDPATVEATGVEAIDFLFVDGDHSYEGVLADLDRWGPMVRPGGVVAFHDTVPTEWAHEPGVVRLVNETKWVRKWASVEWFDPAASGVGITAFTVPG